jgi:hypothetical protein
MKPAPPVTRIIEPSRVFREPIILLDASIGAYFQPPFDLDTPAKDVAVLAGWKNLNRDLQGGVHAGEQASPVEGGAASWGGRVHRREFRRRCGLGLD